MEGIVKFEEESMMMWGCMTWDGVGMACKIDGKMDANLYVQILEDELQQTLVDMDLFQRILSGHLDRLVGRGQEILLELSHAWKRG